MPGFAGIFHRKNELEQGRLGNAKRRNFFSAFYIFSKCYVFLYCFFFQMFFSVFVLFQMFFFWRFVTEDCGASPAVTVTALPA